MIDKYRANKYCCEDISKIENYEEAVNDTTQTWQIHHKDEIRILTSGMTVYRTEQELIENGRYYDCPANELIFLTKSVHSQLHMKYRPKLCDEVYKKAVRTRNANNSTWHSEDTKKKISESTKGRVPWNKGKHYTCSAVSIALTGGHLSNETKLKMSKSRVGRKWYNDGKNEYFIFSKDAFDYYKPGRLAKEKQNEIMLQQIKK